MAGFHLADSPGSGPGSLVQTCSPGLARRAPLCHHGNPWRWSGRSQSYEHPPGGVPGAVVQEEAGRKLNWKQRRKKLGGGVVRREGGGRSSSLIYLVRPVGEGEGRWAAEPSVPVPERTGLGSGSCPFHWERWGAEEQGHSLQRPPSSSVARLRAARSWGLKGPQVPIKI